MSRSKMGNLIIKHNYNLYTRIWITLHKYWN